MNALCAVEEDKNLQQIKLKKFMASAQGFRATLWSLQKGSLKVHPASERAIACLCRKGLQRCETVKPKKKSPLGKAVIETSTLLGLWLGFKHRVTTDVNLTALHSWGYVCMKRNCTLGGRQ